MDEEWDAACFPRVTLSLCHRALRFESPLAPGGAQWADPRRPWNHTTPEGMWTWAKVFLGHTEAGARRSNVDSLGSDLRAFPFMRVQNRMKKNGWAVE